MFENIIEKNSQQNNFQILTSFSAFFFLFYFVRYALLVLSETFREKIQHHIKNELTTKYVTLY